MLCNNCIHVKLIVNPKGYLTSYIYPGAYVVGCKNLKSTFLNSEEVVLSECRQYTPKVNLENRITS